VEKGWQMETLLVPLDGSTFGEHALPAALAIARRGGMRLALAHAHYTMAPAISAAGIPVFDPTIDAQFRDEELAYLKRVVRRVAAVWDGPVTQTLLEAPVDDALCHHAEAIGAALIVLSSHGRGGMSRIWLGSVADRLLRQSAIPILVVHPDAEAPDLGREPPLRRILIPLDGSSLAEHAIELAQWVGRPAGAHYILLRVVEPIMRGFLIDGAEPSVDVDAQEAAYRHATDELAGVASRLREAGLSVTADTWIGQPAAQILEAATTYYADLIAMTSHGRGGVARLLVGSVADKVLRGANVPLLVSRPHSPQA
jgi:nucleotide-binding universal stress UspA family protein